MTWSPLSAIGKHSAEPKQWITDHATKDLSRIHPQHEGRARTRKVGLQGRQARVLSACDAIVSKSKVFRCLNLILVIFNDTVHAVGR